MAKQCAQGLATARSTGMIALPGVPQPSERALGLSVGTGGNVTFSTEVASDSGSWRQDDARWGWTLKRQAADTARGFVWGGTAAGRIDVQGKTDDVARTGRPSKEDNAAMRVDTAIPFGLPA